MRILNGSPNKSRYKNYASGITALKTFTSGSHSIQVIGLGLSFTPTKIYAKINGAGDSAAVLWHGFSNIVVGSLSITLLQVWSTGFLLDYNCPFGSGDFTISWEALA